MAGHGIAIMTAGIGATADTTIVMARDAASRPFGTGTITAGSTPRSVSAAGNAHERRHPHSEAPLASSCRYWKKYIQKFQSNRGMS